MQNRVKVISKDDKELSTCHPARARELIKHKKAIVIDKKSYTIKLKYDITKDNT